MISSLQQFIFMAHNKPGQRRQASRELGFKMLLFIHFVYFLEQLYKISAKRCCVTLSAPYAQMIVEAPTFVLIRIKFEMLFQLLEDSRSE